MRYPLPYAFARTHQLLLEDQEGELTLCLHPDSGASALSRSSPDQTASAQRNRSIRAMSSAKSCPVSASTTRPCRPRTTVTGNPLPGNGRRR